MKTYTKAGDDVNGRVQNLIKKFHPDLALTEAKIDCIFVASDDPDAPALTLHGYPCGAVVKILDSKQRTMGRGDAEIVIAEARYITMKPEECDALLDHELYHLEIVRNKYGRPKLDEHNRPKLKMRLHDHDFGWFAEIAKRHGSASIECKQATALWLSGKQTYFEFALNVKLGDGITATVSLLPGRK